MATPTITTTITYHADFLLPSALSTRRRRVALRIMSSLLLFSSSPFLLWRSPANYCRGDISISSPNHEITLCSSHHGRATVAHHISKVVLFSDVPDMVMIRFYVGCGDALDPPQDVIVRVSPDFMQHFIINKCIRTTTFSSLLRDYPNVGDDDRINLVERFRVPVSLPIFLTDEIIRVDAETQTTTTTSKRNTDDDDKKEIEEVVSFAQTVLCSPLWKPIEGWQKQQQQQQQSNRAEQECYHHHSVRVITSPLKGRDNFLN
eukprot:PhM_4_TR15556/c0_g1_i1/m.39694